VLETKQGLSAARNRGWQEAAGQYVAYVDNDCKMPPGWVDAVINIMHTVAPYCFGGPYLAYYLTEKPRWFKDVYGSNVQADQAEFLGENKYLTGGNIVFQKSVLQTLNGFSSTFGMNGKKVGYADVTELLIRLRVQYGTNTLYFSPDVFLYHLVRPEKMQVRWVFTKNWASGRSHQRMWASTLTEKNRGVVLTFLVNSLGIVLNLIKVSVRILTIWRRNRELYPYVENYFYEVVAWYIREIAKAYEEIASLFTKPDPEPDATG
jgi:glycosyltransferase involved in cell wall biosynthesis